METKELKELRVLKRKLKIYALISIFYIYTNFQRMKILSKSLDCDSTWESAEKTSDLIAMFGGKVSPEEILRSKTKTADEAIETFELLQDEYRDFEKSYGFSKNALVAFFEYVSDKHSFLFNTYDVFHYWHYLENIVMYIDNEITKSELKKELVKINPFTKETISDDFRLIRGAINVVRSYFPIIFR